MCAGAGSNTRDMGRDEGGTFVNYGRAYFGVFGYTTSEDWRDTPCEDVPVERARDAKSMEMCLCSENECLSS